MGPLYLSVLLALGFAAQDFGGRQGGRGGPPFGSLLVTALDANQDAVISAAEMDKAPTALKALDRNADGRIDASELMPTGRGREGGGREGGREGGRGEETGNTPATSADDLVAMLMAFDANKDGQVTKAELPERLQPIFDRSDANKDGKLTADEIKQTAAASSQPTRMGGEGRGREGMGRGPAPVDVLVTALDANHDGVLQADEITDAAKSLRALDKNKDGQLTADEYRQTAGRG